jgi:UDP-N-acetylglucosamine 3-dehydrogenase
VSRGTEDERPRIGVIGCGAVGRTHLDAYRANGVAPAALADSSQEALDAATAAYGGRGYLDVRDLLGSGTVDAVSVCTPPSSHLAIVTAALEAGIAVLCEKPLATRVEDAEALANAAERSGSLLTVGFCHRFQPQIERLRDLAQGGDLGTVLMFRNRFAGHLPAVERTWFSRADIAGGGVMVDTCVHSVDLFRHLVGEPERVEALVSTTATELGPALGVEDSAIIVLRTATGALGSIEASWRTPPGEWTVTLYGTAGAATVDYGSEQLRVRMGDEPDWRVVDVPPGNRFEREIANFLASVRGAARPGVTAADGVAATRILAAAYASARAGVGHPFGAAR